MSGIKLAPGRRDGYDIGNRWRGWRERTATLQLLKDLGALAASRVRPEGLAPRALTWLLNGTPGVLDFAGVTVSDPDGKAVASCTNLEGVLTVAVPGHTTRWALEHGSDLGHGKPVYSACADNPPPNPGIMQDTVARVLYARELYVAVTPHAVPAGPNGAVPSLPRTPFHYDDSPLL